MTMKEYLEPLSLNDFCQLYWGEKIYTNQRINANITNLLRWNEVQSWLKDDSFFSNLEVFLRTDSFTEFTKATTYDEVMRGLDNGMTLQIRYLQNVLDPNSALAKLVRDFQKNVVHPLSSLTLFYSLPTAMPTAIHKDISEIFSIQIAGKKKWWLHHEKCLTDQMCFQEGEIEKWEEFTLSAGNMMYLPSHLPHQVKCVDEPSLSVALVFSNIQFAALLDYMQNNQEIKNWLKKPLPLWSNPDTNAISEKQLNDFFLCIAAQNQPEARHQFYNEIHRYLQQHQQEVENR